MKSVHTGTSILKTLLKKTADAAHAEGESMQKGKVSVCVCVCVCVEVAWLIVPGRLGQECIIIL